MRPPKTTATLTAAVAMLALWGANPLGGQEGGIYRAVTVQAAPGKLLEMIELFQEEQAFARSMGEAPAMMFRHSQGDFWDIFLLYPIPDLPEYFEAETRDRRSRAMAPSGMTGEELNAAIDAVSAWREEVFVHGPPHDEVADLWENSGFFHLETFQGLAGRRAELLHQRRIENDYLERIGKAPNAIFTRIAGASADAFTIGFYRDLAHYAEPNAVSDEEANQAAIDAGFEGRDYIGSYLRSLILRHQDTLGVAIP